MTGLARKRVLVGVTGSIAAYKSADLVRRLRELGAEVRVVMTDAAAAFIAPLTLQALTGHPVRRALLEPGEEAAMGHITLARWADVVLVAPASADFLARLALGLADDLLTTLCLATGAPILLAPAMNREMWANPATRENKKTLERRRVVFLGPATGSQACGETGPGRMLEPVDIVRELLEFWATGPLDGVRVLATAGPTREPLDPVRFLSNRSSGKMGYAVAEAAAAAGAQVTLVSGPVALDAPSGVERLWCETALQMRDLVMDRIGSCDIFVSVAAVADYRPEVELPEKLKKDDSAVWQLRMVRSPDILAEVAAREDARPFCVGFAAETERVAEQAENKRRQKGIDMIAANRVGEGPGGFDSDDNALTVFWDHGRQELPLMPKSLLARRLVAIIAERYHEKKHSSQNT